MNCIIVKIKLYCIDKNLITSEILITTNTKGIMFHVTYVLLTKTKTTLWDLKMFEHNTLQKIKKQIFILFNVLV